MFKSIHRLSAGLMIATLLASAGCATAADSDSSPSTVYLDPHTGQVVQSPKDKASSEHGGSRKTPAGTPDDPDTVGGKRIVHCADGSLRMGSTRRGGEANDHDDAAALCGRAGG